MLNSHTASRPSNQTPTSSYLRRSSANPIPAASSDSLVRPRPTRQRSVSNVINPSKSSSDNDHHHHVLPIPPPITSTNSWFNTLADGLNWIETQGGNVVTSATQATTGGLSSGLGLGETIIRGGLGKRPLSLVGFGGGGGGGVGGTPTVSENGDAGSESGIGLGDNNFMLPPPLANGSFSTSSTGPTSTSSTPLKRRPASFLGLMKPRPQTPPSSNSYNHPGMNNGTPASTQTTPTATPTWDRAASPIANTSSTSAITHPNASSTYTSSPPFIPTRSSSTLTPTPNANTNSNSNTNQSGRPTVTRLGPPRPSNLARIRGSTDHPHAPLGPPSSSSGASGSTSSTPVFPLGRSTTDPTRAGLGGLVKSGSTGSVDRLGMSGGLGAAPTGGGVGMERQSSGMSASNGGGGGGGGGGSRSGTPIPTHPNPSLPSSSPGLPTRTRSYKPGFQPPGVRSDRTETFEQARRKVAEERGREEGRLGKRWGKLIDLHFNPMAGLEVTNPGLRRSTTSTSSTSNPNSSLSRPSLSSLPSVNLNLAAALTTTFDGIKPKDVWRGFRSATGVGLEQVEWEKKREVEKGLVVWEEDGEVRRCRICQSIFSLTNRKHHCRLCGRIVCSLPPTSQAILALTAPIPSLTPSIIPDTTRNVNPRTGLPLGTRRETCSLLLVADYRTGRGQEVDENFVGWMQMGNRKNVEVGDTMTPAAAARRPDEVQVKGVRTCRECWQTVSRKQKMADRNQVDRFTRLYAALKSLEGEISETVPEYQDSMEEISQATNPAGPIPIHVMNLHKHLIAMFAEYDALTKRVRTYPCSPGSARERVQVAIARQASLFMAREAGVLQLLPKIQKQRHKRATSSIMSGDSTPAGSEMAVPILPASVVADDKTAMMLQPLLEQEAQLEAFITEAKTQRKLEDAMTLQTSLEELRQEIARIASG